MKTITKLGLICGAGELPFVVLEAAKKLNIPVVIVLIKNFANPKLTINNEYFVATLGQLGMVVKKFHQSGVSHVCFVGAVKRPSIFNLQLDALSKELLVNYIRHIHGDNSLLSLIVQIFEERFGFTVIGPQSLDPHILCSDDFYSQLQPTAEQLEDIGRGVFVGKQIGLLDIGQSLVIQQKIIIAVEGVEGTNNLIKRSKKLLKKGGSKGILIKLKKPNQESRIDLPTIGIQTIKAINKTGLAGMAIENGATIILNKKEILDYANAKGLLVTTINGDSCR